jgi:hypothetical protein
MNDIEKLVAATQREHDKTRPAARFFVSTALFLNVVLPIMIVIGIVLAVLFFK